MSTAPNAFRSFIVTIDTEGDNLWARTNDPTTHNARFLPRFQSLCERYGLKPVYLVDYQMANCGQLREFAAETLRRGQCEIGMHLHAWSTPPINPLTTGDNQKHPYLINFSGDMMREKVAAMTGVLEEAFGLRPVSHRAGRWAMDSRYIRILTDLGYKIDCSVTPHVKWDSMPSYDGVSRGADYRKFPDQAYIMEHDAIDRAGDSGILEVPMTTVPLYERWDDVLRTWVAPLTVKIGRFTPRVAWLRPTGKNLLGMMRLLGHADEKRADYVEFMLHSSEFMPGGSPTFKDERSIEALYADMEQLFAAATKMGFSGATLSEYHVRWTRQMGLQSEDL